MRRDIGIEVLAQPTPREEAMMRSAAGQTQAGMQAR